MVGSLHKRIYVVYNIFREFKYLSVEGGVRMKKILLFLANGFEEIEAYTVVDLLRRRNVICDTCSIYSYKKVVGAHRVPVEADKTLDEIDNLKSYDGVVIPGGLPGATNLRDDERVVEIVRDFSENGKLVAAICAGPIVLQRAGILKDRKVTSYPGFDGELKDSVYKEDIVVQDENIITARGPATAVYFALKILENLIDRKQVEDLKKEILLDMVEGEFARFE